LEKSYLAGKARGRDGGKDEGGRMKDEKDGEERERVRVPCLRFASMRREADGRRSQMVLVGMLR
jgi:hypothetical protein